jgi:hypothetical protein
MQIAAVAPGYCPDAPQTEAAVFLCACRLAVIKCHFSIKPISYHQSKLAIRMLRGGLNFTVAGCFFTGFHGVFKQIAEDNNISAFFKSAAKLAKS